MKQKNLLLAAIIFVAVSLGLVACQKNYSGDVQANSSGKEQLSLYLTDGPGLFDQVLVDIRSVKVLVDTSKDTRRHDNDDWDRRGADDRKKDSSFVWETLNIQAGVYDILKFRNGADTLLAASNITKGSIRLIKIELGTNNSVVKDSVVYPVKLPANANAYVLIKLRGNECEEFAPGRRRLWLDFDITRSIIQERDNQFYLRPVFHFFVVSNTASISGKVGPRDGYPVVTVFNASDTAYALPDKEGNFKVRGLASGTYSVYINASNGYADTTINNVVLQAPKLTTLGTIKLHK
jgi:hypothetical protein